MRRSNRHRHVRSIALVFLLAAAAPARAQQSAFLIGLLSKESSAERAVNPLDADFARSQLRHPRVLDARINARYGIKQLYRERGIPYPAAEVFMRVFKRERVLELWVRPAGEDRFALLKEYRICALAGEIGPKRKQGDNQTPEGFYEIDSFNPNSEYLLSLHVNYPNDSDRALGYRDALGGAIFIHGGCKTIGCIAVTDDAIEELYWIAVEARAAGQEHIPLHIFPARLTDDEMKLLGGKFGNRKDLLAFWQSLRPGYEYFERTRTLPRIGIDGSGRYRMPAAENGAASAQRGSGR
jgi:murein L,D-transpeptidase YafK